MKTTTKAPTVAGWYRVRWPEGDDEVREFTAIGRHLVDNFGTDWHSSEYEGCIRSLDPIPLPEMDTIDTEEG